MLVIYFLATWLTLNGLKRGEKEDRKTGYWLLQQPSKKWWGFIWWQWEEERRHQGHCTGRADFLIGYVAASHHQEKAMAPHSSTLAWRIPWTEEPSGLQSTGSQRVGHDWVTSRSQPNCLVSKGKHRAVPEFTLSISSKHKVKLYCFLWAFDNGYKISSSFVCNVFYKHIICYWKFLLLSILLHSQTLLKMVRPIYLHMKSTKKQKTVFPQVFAFPRL